MHWVGSLQENGPPYLKSHLLFKRCFELTENDFVDNM